MELSGMTATSSTKLIPAEPSGDETALAPALTAGAAMGGESANEYVSDMSKIQLSVPLDTADLTYISGIPWVLQTATPKSRGHATASTPLRGGVGDNPSPRGGG